LAHKITYKNTPSAWYEALPLGNGYMGTMVYNQNGRVIYPVNNYNIYFRDMTIRDDPNFSLDNVVTDTSHLETVKKKAIEAREDVNHPGHMNYNAQFLPEPGNLYGWDRDGNTMPMTGEYRLLVNEKSETLSELTVETATHVYKSGEVEITTKVLRGDAVIVNEINGAVKAVELAAPVGIGLRCDRVPEFKTYMPGIYYFVNRIYSNDTLYSGYVMMLKLDGADCGEPVIDGMMTIPVLHGGKFKIICSVAGDIENNFVFDEELLTELAYKKIAGVADNYESKIDLHTKYWEEFSSRSAISIPDKMLEDIWYINIYALDCCSGRGALTKTHACGLNGLWDIKQPSQWGSSWYWDVNIEEAYWGIYTSNHMDIGYAYYDALETYYNRARARAKAAYGARGLASDDPFAYYYCTWLWIAQNFWWHYTYTGDLEFLEKRTLPLYTDLAHFLEDVLSYDETTGTYYIFPEISPEQGPLTRNSTNSLSCMRFLFTHAVDACKILGVQTEDIANWENILAKLPSYPVGYNAVYGGEHMIDSEWADENLFLAHSGVLMPIFPCKDITRHSPPEIYNLALNTLNYANVRNNICTHTYSWNACAEAAIGLGDQAVKTIYEKILTWCMRSNGMFYEETERWIQNCLVACAPVYNPPLMECGGAVSAAINELLLQSSWNHGEPAVIDVFSAIPKGIDFDGGYETKKFDFNFRIEDKYIARWTDCEFEKLHAQGAFEVSAKLTGGEIEKIVIKSLAGNSVKLIYPGIDDAICFDTEIGGIYTFTGKSTKANENSSYVNSGGVYTSRNKARVFIGKDDYRSYQQAIDSFTHSFHQGDTETSRITRYKLDFSADRKEFPKNYFSTLYAQFHTCGKIGLQFKRVTKDLKHSYRNYFGFTDTDGINYENFNKDDMILTDALTSTLDKTLKIHFTSGHYQFLFIYGNENDNTATNIKIGGKQAVSDTVTAGRVKTKIVSFDNETDGYVDLGFSTSENSKWSVYGILVNQIY